MILLVEVTRAKPIVFPQLLRYREIRLSIITLAAVPFHTKLFNVLDLKRPVAVLVNASELPRNLEEERVAVGVLKLQARLLAIVLSFERQPSHRG
eukprot:UN5146